MRDFSEGLFLSPIWEVESNSRQVRQSYGDTPVTNSNGLCLSTGERGGAQLLWPLAFHFYFSRQTGAATAYLIQKASLFRDWEAIANTHAYNVPTLLVLLKHRVYEDEVSGTWDAPHDLKTKSPDFVSKEMVWLVIKTLLQHGGKN